MTTYLDSGWEDSGGSDTTDDGKWNSEETSTGDDVTVNNTDPHDGSYCIDCYCNGGGGDWAYMWKNISGGTTTLYVNAWYKFLTAFPSTSNSYVIMEIRGSQSYAQLRLYNSSGTIIVQLAYRNGDTLYYDSFTPSPSLSLSTWYNFEVKVYNHNSAGEVRVYFGGEEKLTKTGLDTDNYGNSSNIDIGERYSIGATVHTIRVDSVLAKDTYIGVLTEVFVTDGLGLTTETVLANKTFAVTDTMGLADQTPKFPTKTVIPTDLISLLESVGVIPFYPEISKTMTEYADFIFEEGTYDYSEHAEKKVDGLLEDATKIVTVEQTYYVKIVTESITMSDAAPLIDITKLALDTIALAEVVSVTKSVGVIVQDDIKLTEETLVLETTKAVTDAISLAEVVTAFKLKVVTDSVSLAAQPITTKDRTLVTDSIGLSESPLANKTLLVTDIQSIVDEAFKNKQVAVLDSLALASLIQASRNIIVTDNIALADLVYTLRQMIVTDSLGLSDATPIVTKVLIVPDLIGITDTVTRASKFVEVLDSLQLGDEVKVNKLIITQDNIVIADLAVREGEENVFSVTLIAHDGKIVLYGSKGNVTVKGSKGEYTLA